MSVDVPGLELEGVIGFGGSVVQGLAVLPDGVHSVFPLGAHMVLKNTASGEQIFLMGHSNAVSCVALSHRGKLLATGQVTHMGFKADVIVWDLEATLRQRRGVIAHRLSLHKVKVQGVAFSHDDSLLATLGGRDDNNLVVWDVASGEPLCGSPAASDTAQAVTWYSADASRLVTAGHNHVRIWALDAASRKLRPTDCRVGSVRRNFTAAVVSPSDRWVYCGTTSGDILKFNAENGHFVNSSKSRFVQGILCLSVLEDTRARNDVVIVGTGAGAVSLNTSSGRDLIEEVKSVTLKGGVTSISVDARGGTALVGTSACTTHVVRLPSLEVDLRGTAHDSRVSDVAFPAGSSEIFASCGGDTVRIWNTSARTELLRIHVPNLECLSVRISPDGASVLTGWSDGKIRSFTPESGRLQYVITDAHTDAVTALAYAASGDVIVSGGRDGRVRVWQLSARKQTMLASFKEHRASVTGLHLRHDDKEVVSSSDDGSCIVWDMERLVRTNAVFASTLFKRAQYHPDGSQLLTCGSDRRITYWDSVEGTAIRILDSNDAEVSSLDIDARGEFFVSGSRDGVVRLWHYDDGVRHSQGDGHSGGVECVRISPDRTRIVSTGSEGGIFIWRFPQVGH